ncbi:ABC-type Mn2+/Zn2+ transport system ATPase subunit/ABC-type Mn2+/Zn2+ transport system permease subunit [Pseudomonas sp. SORGH_AS199]|nr:ABC-type Mn2+/Zn2+ transport system ATPase subunit/ABC-type Mn2+/Zn2+ transport system permease subunit [Pseudomonas sp. SORGH_AS_0199]
MIALDGVGVTYRNGHTALRDASLVVPGGSITALVGVNGSGKSTLFKAIMGFVPLRTGQVRVDDLPVAQALKRNLVAYVPQSEDVDWDFPVRVEDVVLMGRYGRMNFLRLARAADHQAVDAALARVGLTELRKRQIGELSGGQKKRVFLARALAQDSRVILLDEPFTGVDATSERAIIELLQALRGEGRSMLVSTHDLASIERFCDRTVLLDRTVLAQGPTAEVFTPGKSGTHLWRRAAPVRGGPGGAAAPGACLMEGLLEPLAYGYMRNALGAAALVGGLCAFLSAFLMLKGWSLIGDALSHAVVPGVAGAYLLGLPLALGAFLAGGAAAGAMLGLRQYTRLKEDVIIGLIFSAFFGGGLFLVSLAPVAVDIQTIVFGNILAITPEASRQLLIIATLSLLVLLLKWRDLLLVFFDEGQARACGLNPTAYRLLFFTLLALSTVAAMQTVGAFLVIALVVTPGATAYLLSDRFSRVVLISVAIGVGSGLLGTYLSYFLDGATGGCVVVLQTLIFLLAFVLAPRHGLLANRRRARQTAEAG